MATQNIDTTDLRARGENVREQLSNVIKNISPTEYVLQANAGEMSTAKNMERSWLDDKIRPARMDNNLVVGGQFVRVPDESPARLSMYHQTSYEYIEVSRIAEISDTAGRKSELARLLIKAGKAIKGDMELISQSDQATRRDTGDEGDPNSAGLTAGLGSWARLIDDRGAGGAAPALSETTHGRPDTGPTAGAPRALSLQSILDVTSAQYVDGASANMLMMGTELKGKFSRYMLNSQNPSARIASPTQDHGADPAGGVTVVGSVDVMVTDFNKFDIVPSRHTPNDRVYSLDTDHIEYSYFDGFKRSKVYHDRDAVSEVLLLTWGLGATSSEAVGIIADIDPTAEMED